VNLVLLELSDSGFLSDLEEKWFKDNSQCDNDSDADKEIHVIALIIQFIENYAAREVSNFVAVCDRLRKTMIL